MASTINVGILRALLTADTAQFDAAMQRAGDKSNSFAKQLGFVKSALVGWGLTQLVRDAVSFGSQLSDLSVQTGISVGGLQKLDAVGRTVGVSLEQAARGVNLMQRNLMGDKGAQRAVEAMGLSVQDLVAMKPDEAFLAIGRAVAELPNSFDRTAAATKALGRAGAQALPLLLADVEKITAGMEVMSDEVVAGLDMFDDAWANTSRNAQASIGTLIGSFTSLEGVLRLLSANPFMGNTGDKAGAARIRDYVDAIRGIYELPGTAPPVLGTAIPEAAGASGKALDDLAKSQDALNKETELSIKAAEEYQKQIQEIADTLTGKALAKKVKELTDAYGGLTEAQKKDAAVSERLVEDIEKLFKAGARLSPQLLELWQRHDKLTDVRRTEEELLLRLASRESAYSTILAKTGANLQIVSAEQQAALRANAQALILQDAQARGLEEYNQYLEYSTYLTSVATAETEQAAPAVRGLGAAWGNVGASVVDVIGHMKDAMGGAFAQMLLGAQSFREGWVSIWESIKSAMLNILNSVLSYFINGFLNGMLNAIMGKEAPFASAFGSLFKAGSGGGAADLLNPGSMAGAGGKAGSAFVSGLSSALYAGAAAYGLYKFWDIVIGKWTGGPSPERFDRIIGYQDGDPNQPIFAPGIEQDEYDRRYGGPDYNHTTDDTDNLDPNVPAGTSGPDWSHLHGLRGGTNGAFPDWGTGTPVMLHGREAVVPYSDRNDWNMGGSGGQQIVMMVDGRVFGEVMAPAISEAIQRVGVTRV